MASHTRVLNVTTNHWLKRNKARGRVEQCLSVWVEGQEGFQIRDLSLAEVVAARAEQARRREPLALAEIHGLKWEPPAGAVAAFRQSRTLAFEAHKYAESCA